MISTPATGTAPGLVYDAQAGGHVPIPPSERALQSVVAEPWFKVADEGIPMEGPTFDREGDLLFVEAADATTPKPLGTSVPYHFTASATDAMRTDADGNIPVAMYGQGRVLAFNRNGIPIGPVLLPGRDEGHNHFSTSMALKPGTDEGFIVTNDGDGGQGSSIFHARICAKAFPLFSHR